MHEFLLVLLVSFILSALLTPAVRLFAKRLKLRQTVLSYVDNHASKSGTPTMGGIAFIVALEITLAIFKWGNASLTVLLLLITPAFGVVGFLDDFIKAYFCRNEGLLPWQKLVFQLLVAIVVSVFAARNALVGDRIYLPFSFNEVSLGAFAVPFYVFVFIAFTNAVNLTDGLDGLAASGAVIYTIFFTAILGYTLYSFGYSQAQREENINLIYYCLALVGALMGFLLYNGFPASIFMGDTGSLALGGALAGLAIMTRLVLLAPVVGIVYVVSCVSDIIQVAHYKRTKRRVFLMAPLHHHFERKGVHENKIVTLYAAVTFVVGLTALLLTLISV